VTTWVATSRGATKSRTVSKVRGAPDASDPAVDDDPWRLLLGGAALKYEIDLPPWQQSRGALHEHPVGGGVEHAEG